MAWERNLVNRRFAANANTEDAYVTGYFYFYVDMQKDVFERIVKVMDSFYKNQREDSKEEVIYDPKIYTATCLSVSLQDGTLNVESLPVMGGIKFGTATNIDFPNTFTTRHVELSGLPVFAFTSAWMNLIRDRNTGVSKLSDEDINADYTKMNFIADVYYWTTKPNGVDIQFAAKFEGCFPTNDPLDKFSHDVATVAVVQHDINWSFDSIWCNKKVVEKITSEIYPKIKGGIKETIDKHIS